MKNTSRKKILILATSGSAKSCALTIQAMKEKFGENIELVTIEEAEKRNLEHKDFANVPVFEIKNTHEDFGKIYFEPSKKQGKGGRARKKGKWWL
jgi:hypothetical protein